LLRFLFPSGDSPRELRNALRLAVPREGNGNASERLSKKLKELPLALPAPGTPQTDDGAVEDAAEIVRRNACMRDQKANVTPVVERPAPIDGKCRRRSPVGHYHLFASSGEMWASGTMQPPPRVHPVATVGAAR